MLIHELVRHVGLPAHTIRFYEKEGLLEKEHTQRMPNGYRHYSAESAQRLLLIKRGQAAGFTLAEIRSLIGAWESGELTLQAKCSIIQNKLEALEARIAQLQEMQAYLQDKLTALTHDSAMPAVQSAATDHAHLPD